MKSIILCLNTANKPSHMSEGGAEIRINNQPCKGINLTTWHMQAQRAPWVATVHDTVKETIRAHLTLVHVFHAYASAHTPWVAHALSHYTHVRYGRISSVSAAHNATQFGDSICSVCISTFQILVQQGSTDAGLNRHRRGLLPWSSEYQIRPLPSFPSNILHFPLIAPSGLQLCEPFDHFAKLHRNSIDRKAPIASGFHPHKVFYRQPTHLGIAYYRFNTFIGVNKVV
jgi:hypothetical protein